MTKPTYDVDVAPDWAAWGPPGTGKTTTLMDEMSALLEDGHRPTDIGGFTYRKIMADEFAERAAEVAGSVPDGHWFRTTHAGCFRLLDLHTDDVVDNATFRDFCNAHGYTTGLVHRDEDPEEADDSPWAATLTGDREAEGEVLWKARSYCLNSGLDFSRWRKAPLTGEERTMMSDRFFSRFNAEYEEWKSNQGLVDFDDMLLSVVEHDLAPPVDILIEDEFQDKTPLQVAVYNVWADAADEVYVAGDPFQAIYTYQGTDPAFMRDAFDMADESHVLRTSWRLGPDVVNVARKTLRRYYDVPDIEPTGEANVRRISWDEYPRFAARHADDETFHLARANYHLRRCAGVLSDEGIPFRSVTARWSDRQLNLFNGVAKMVRAFEDAEPLEQPDFGLTTAELKAVAQAVPASALQGKKSVVDEAIDAGAGVAGLMKIGDVGALLSGNPFADLGKRDSTTLVPSAIGNEGVQDRMRSAFASRGAVPIDSINHELSTIHGAKGREADVVFLLDASTPAIRDDSDPKDESRVFYVGVSRVRKHLYLVQCPWATVTTAALPMGAL